MTLPEFHEQFVSIHACAYASDAVLSYFHVLVGTINHIQVIYHNMVNYLNVINGKIVGHHALLNLNIHVTFAFVRLSFRITLNPKRKTVQFKAILYTLKSRSG